MKWLIPLLVLIFFELIADILAKKWSLLGGTVLIVGALFAYMAANTSWLLALRSGAGLGRGAVIFSVASALLAVLVGVVLYDEPVTRPQLLGMLLGIMSLVLIFWE